MSGPVGPALAHPSTHIDDQVCVARKPGRPRDERADRAIVQATLELFVDEGYSSLSVEAVALRAGVSKATIYRRWPGKRELVVDSLATLNDDLPVVEAGTAAERILAMLRHMSTKDPDSLPGRIMPRMLVYRVSQPDLYAEYFDRVVMPRRQVLYRVLRDGIASGELRPDLDVELATLALAGPIMTAAHSQDALPDQASLPERLLALLWPGLVAAGAQSA